MDTFFKFSERGSNAATEVRAVSSSQTQENSADISENSHIYAPFSSGEGRSERTLPPSVSVISAPCPSPVCLNGVR